jgi:DNA-binding beta-propeller fold protein YncE
VSFVVQVMVTQVASSIEVSPNPAEVSGKRRRRLSARLLDAVGAPMKGHSLVFTSSDPDEVAVSSDGVLAAGDSRGGATVTEQARGTSLRAYVPVHVVNATRRTGRIVSNASIPGAFSAVPVATDEAYVAALGVPVVRVNLATGATALIPDSEGGYGIAFCRPRGEVYAGAYVKKSLDVISVERQMVIATIQVPDRVVDIVVSRDARFAYLGLSNGIAVLDLQAREVTKLSIPLFGLHLALHPSKPLLYVSGNGPTVSEIDLTSGKRARTFALTTPALGQAVGVTPDGAALYVANELANCIDAFDLSTGRLIRSLELQLGGVWGMVLSPDGRRLFANGAGSGGIVAIDSTTGHVLKTYNSTGGHRITLSADGLTLLAAGAGNGLLVMR